MHHTYRQNWSNLAEGAAVAGLLLTAEHIALWRERGWLPQEAKYVMGTIAIGIGLTVAARGRGDTRTIIEFWTIASTGGALVVAAHLTRRVLFHQREMRRDAILRETNALRA